MAETFQVDLVAPERRLASIAATAVEIPGAEGDLTAMPGHAPLITALRPGILRIDVPTGDSAYLVTGGFAEINATSVSVLAEQAIPVSEASPAIVDQLIAEAQSLAAAALPEDRAAADKLVADIQALRVRILG